MNSTTNKMNYVKRQARESMKKGAVLAYYYGNCEKEEIVSAPVIKCKKTPVKKCRFATEKM